MRDHHQRLTAARETLDGLSVGDALGEALSYRFYKAREACDFSVFRDGSVRYTDDTEILDESISGGIAQYGWESFWEINYVSASGMIVGSGEMATGQWADVV